MKFFVITYLILVRKEFFLTKFLFVELYLVSFSFRGIFFYLFCESIIQEKLLGEQL